MTDSVDNAEPEGVGEASAFGERAIPARTATWSEGARDNPMRCAGRLLSGAWLALLTLEESLQRCVPCERMEV